MTRTSQTPFKIIYADPPWSYDDDLTMSKVKRGAATNYPTMSVEQICDLYQPSRQEHVKTGGRNHRFISRQGQLAGHPIADDAICLLWVTKDVLLEGIGQRVMLTWGFTPKQLVPWVKGRIATEFAVTGPFTDRSTDVVTKLVLQKGMGRIFRNVVEYLLVGARGKYSQLVLNKGVDGLIFEEEVILEPRTTHSTKPSSMYGRIERMFPGPYLELFARNTREGWVSWGNEIAADAAGTAISISTDVDGNPTTYDNGTAIEHTPSGFLITRPAPALPETTIDWP